MNIDHNFKGLTEAWILDGNGGGRELDSRGISSEELATLGLLWLHMDYSKQPVQDWMKQHSGLADLTSEALLQAETRPRCVSSDQGLMLFLRGVNQNPGSEPEDMVSIRIWVDEQRIVSLGMRKLLSIDDMVMMIKQGRGPRTTGDFITMLLDTMMDRASTVIENLSDTVDSLDDSVLTEANVQQRTTLLDVRRQAITLRRFLAPQREAMNRLTAEKTSILTDEHHLYVREEADRLTRLIEDLDAARERASVIHESLVNRLAEMTNKRMYLLSVMAAVFLPLSFITGLLGINVGGIPGADSQLGFAMVLIFVAVIAAGLWIFFRWRRWL